MSAVQSPATQVLSRLNLTFRLTQLLSCPCDGHDMPRPCCVMLKMPSDNACCSRCHGPKTALGWVPVGCSFEADRVADVNFFHVDFFRCPIHGATQLETPMEKLKMDWFGGTPMTFWLVVWNMAFICFYVFLYIGNVIIPTVTHSIIFQRGRAKNHRPALEAPILLRSNLSESTSPIHGADGAGHDGCSNQPACTEQGLAFRNHCWPSQALQKSQRVTALQKSSCFLGILVTLNSFWKWFHWNIFKVSDLWVTRPVIRFTICAIIFFFWTDGTMPVPGVPGPSGCRTRSKISKMSKPFGFQFGFQGMLISTMTWDA